MSNSRQQNFTIPRQNFTKKCYIIGAVQHNLKEKTMFDFTKQTKQFEQLAERIKEVNEFWVNAFISSIKQFTK
jgi:hypothetical protein